MTRVRRRECDDVKLVHFGKLVPARRKWGEAQLVPGDDRVNYRGGVSCGLISPYGWLHGIIPLQEG